MFEAEQVQLQLTNVSFILNELRKKKRLVQDAKGEEVFQIQFDSRVIEFRKGRIVTLGKTIAEALERDACVIVGPALDGEVHPVLDIVKEFNLSEGQTVTTPTTCLYCNEEQYSVKGLSAHLIAEHADQDEEEKPVKPTAKKTEK